MSSREALKDAVDLHKRIIAFDSHVDVPRSQSGPDFSVGGQFDLRRAREGGLSGATLVVHGPPVRPGEETVSSRLSQEQGYREIQALAASDPAGAAIVRTADEVRRNAAESRFSIAIGFQNAGVLDPEVASLDPWIDRGISVVAFNFIGNNAWSDSARPYPFFNTGQNGGLTALGKAAVRHLNQRGVLVDVSQMSSSAFADTLAESRAPVVASHSSVRAMVDFDRNFSIGELEALKANGGVIQMVGFGMYLKPMDAPLLARLAEFWRTHGLEPPTTTADFGSVNDPKTALWSGETFWHFLHEWHVLLDLGHPAAQVADLVDAIEFALDKTGIEHVGIASDFNHGGGLADWMHVGQSLNITAELLERGYGDEDIAKLWGGNYLRVWDAALAASA